MEQRLKMGHISQIQDIHPHLMDHYHANSPFIKRRISSKFASFDSILSILNLWDRWLEIATMIASLSQVKIQIMSSPPFAGITQGNIVSHTTVFFGAPNRRPREQLKHWFNLRLASALSLVIPSVRWCWRGSGPHDSQGHHKWEWVTKMEHSSFTDWMSQSIKMWVYGVADAMPKIRAWTIIR